VIYIMNNQLTACLQGIVTVKIKQQEHHPVKDKPDSMVSRYKFSNKDLPEGCLDKYWRSRFIPTFINFAGNYSLPWTIEDDTAVTTLRKMWSKIYGSKIVHRVEINDAVFNIVSRSHTHMSPFPSHL
jgi:hypothetical protein